VELHGIVVGVDDPRVRKLEPHGSRVENELLEGDL
jgi:hypothetical protein